MALAHLLAEDRRPPDSLWAETLVSSRLLEYEAWTRVHARGLGLSVAELVDQLLGRIAFLELIGEVLTRARAPFPTSLRTLDALHLASADFIRARRQRLAIASYDERLLRAARSLELDILPLD